MDNKNRNAADREVAEDSLNSLFSDDGDDIFSVDDDSEDYSQYDNLGDDEDDELSDEEIRKRLQESWLPFKFFSPFYYDEPDIPDEAISIVDGKEIVKPQVTGKWECEYYYSPQRKVVMAQHLAMGFTGIFLSLSAIFDNAAGGILSFILLAILVTNVFFRYTGLALYNRPMPELPIPSIDIFGNVINTISEFRESMAKEREDKKRRKEQSRKQEEFDEYKEENHSTMYVDPVDDYSGDYPSPATILSDWMNSVAQMTKGDLVEASDGRINNFVATMLLKDNPEVWDDDDIVDSLAQVTSSHPSEWKKARDSWRETS